MNPSRLTGLRLLFKGARISADPVRLTQRSIFLLPTKLGVFFLCLTAAVLVGAVNYGNNLAYGLAFLLLSLGLVSVLHTYRNLAGIRVMPGRVDDVFAGREARFGLILQETAGRRRFSIRLKEQGPVSQTDLRPNRKTGLSLAAPTVNRGLRRLSHVKISSTYPLGISLAWSWVRPDMSCMVYPRPVRSPTALSSRYPSSGSGSGSNGHLSGADDFREIAELLPGDSYKRIDWKAVARGRGLVVRHFSSEDRDGLWFDYQDFSDLETEEALSVLAGLILEAEQAGIHYGLGLPGETFWTNRGNEHMQACLRGLALFNASSGSG